MRFTVRFVTFNGAGGVHVILEVCDRPQKLLAWMTQYDCSGGMATGKENIPLLWARFVSLTLVSSIQFENGWLRLLAVDTTKHRSGVIVGYDHCRVTARAERHERNMARRVFTSL
jgi:hypothetical protein